MKEINNFEFNAIIQVTFRTTRKALVNLTKQWNNRTTGKDRKTIYIFIAGTLRSWKSNGSLRVQSHNRVFQPLSN